MEWASGIGLINWIPTIKIIEDISFNFILGFFLTGIFIMVGCTIGLFIFLLEKSYLTLIEDGK